MNFVSGLLLLLTPDLEALRQRAVEQFTNEFGAPVGEIRIDLNPRECLRTGYQRSTGRIVFCQSGRVNNGGLESVDVINHEFFHALFCGKYPARCASDDFDHVHEALADAFSYRLNPDAYFGEHFYTDAPYIRAYSTDWIPELVQSEHERGRAIAARLIRGGRPLAEGLDLFQEPVDSFVSVHVEGAPFSKLNRYRFSPGQKIKLEFRFDPRVDVREVVWDLPRGMREDSGLQMTDGFSGGKAYARFLSAERKELGRWTFYFGKTL